MKQKWNYVPFEDAVEIWDIKRKPINNSERASRINGKSNNELYPYYGATGQVGFIDDYLTDGEYVLLGEDGAPFLNPIAQKAYIVTGKTWVNNHAHVLKSKYNNKFLCYYLNSINYKDYVSGTTRLKLTQAQMKRILIPVPSIEEQERIVSKIEELFSKLDNAVETLNATKTQLKLYKQAVLKNAFDGKLTNNGNPEIKELASFIEHPRYGTSKKCNYQNDIEAYTEVYRIPNIDASTGTLDKSDLKYAKFDEDEIEKLSLKYGDILIIRSNGSPSIVGTAAMVREQDVSGLFAGYLIRIRISDHERLSPKYLLRYLSSYDARRYIENVSKSTSGVNNVNAQEIKKIKVPYFKKKIQDQIIYAIDSRLSAYENIEKTVNDALQQASAMRQSILKQAFEGRLI